MATETMNAKDVKDAGKDVGNKLADKMNDVKDNVKATAEEFKSQIQDYSDEVVEYIKKCPIKSVSIAAGVGMLLAIFLKK